MSDSQRQPPGAGNGHGETHAPRGDRARGRDGRRTARAGEPEPPRSSLGANAAAGEIGSAKQATGAPARPELPPPGHGAGLPPPPTSWTPPRTASDASGAWSRPDAVTPGPLAADTLEDMPALADMAVPVAADASGDTDVVPSVASSGPVAVPPSGQPQPAEKRSDSFDDFAQESPPVSELTGERTVPAPRPDPTVLTDEPRADETQLVRQRAGDLPRRQGVLGDLRYALAALLDVVRTRKQLRDLREKLEVEREARNGLVRLMVRELLGNRAVDVEAVREARALLDEVEAERARHAAAVVTTTAEIAALEEDGDAESLAADAEIGRIAGVITTLDRQIETLEQTVAARHRQLNQARVEVRRLEKQIARLDKQLDSDSAEEVERVQAELAGTRAMHEAALAAQPRIQAELQELLPRIEELQARQAEREGALAAAQERVQAIDEQAAQRVTAAQARKEAAERALAATADEVRELVASLGERLCLERPESPLVAPRMAMIDGCDSGMADVERQMLEGSERLRRIDRAAVARGALLAIGLSAVMAALIWLGLRL